METETREGVVLVPYVRELGLEPRADCAHNTTRGCSALAQKDPHLPLSATKNHHLPRAAGTLGKDQRLTSGSPQGSLAVWVLEPTGPKHMIPGVSPCAGKSEYSYTHLKKGLVLHKQVSRGVGWGWGTRPCVCLCMPSILGECAPPQPTTLLF